jgi:hypothetical protein
MILKLSPKAKKLFLEISIFLIFIFVVFSFYFYFLNKSIVYAETLYFDNFESGLGNWSNVTGDDCDWIRDSGGTPSSSTGPSIDHTLGNSSGYYMFVETSRSGCYYSGEETYFESPTIDADSYSIDFSFWYHMYGSNTGTLNVDVYDGSWHNVWSLSGQQHTGYTDPFDYAEVDLDAYTGSIKIRVRYVAAGGYKGDTAIDDLTIERTVRNSSPTISDVSHSPDPQEGGSSITFDSTSSDPDGDDIKLYICQDSSCTNCEPGNTSGCYAISDSWASSNPSASYTCPSCNYSDNNYYAKVCDSNNACSDSTTVQTFTSKKEDTCSCSCEDGVCDECYGGYCNNGICQSVAPSSCNVEGYAWSENIGWLSFSCENQSSCGTSSYGVYIDEGTGDFSGYAWSENIGWVDFAPSGPYPTSPDSSVVIDLGTGDLSGWARALAGEDDSDDGWDGWIKMSGSAYGVSFDSSTNEFSGYAWSDSVIGWISFNCLNEASCGVSDYQVTAELSTAPSITDLTHSFTSPCSQSRIPTFSWETDAELPYDYDIRICSDSSCSSELVSQEVRSTSSKSWTPSCTYCCNTSPYNNIDFGGGTYYAQVRVSEAGEESWSGWEEETFNTYSQCYPYADFLCDGGNCGDVQIYEEAVVELTDSSTTYDGLLSCSWTLPDIATLVDGYTTSDCDIEVMFSAPPPGQRNQDVTLSVTDSSSYSCSETKTLEIRFPLPEYKEVIPTN